MGSGGIGGRVGGGGLGGGGLGGGAVGGGVVVLAVSSNATPPPVASTKSTSNAASATWQLRPRAPNEAAASASSASASSSASSAPESSSGSRRDCWIRLSLPVLDSGSTVDSRVPLLLLAHRDDGHAWPLCWMDCTSQVPSSSALRLLEETESSSSPLLLQRSCVALRDITRGARRRTCQKSAARRLLDLERERPGILFG